MEPDLRTRASLCPDVALYLERKRREMALLESCLEGFQGIERADTAAQVVDRKFQLAAALRAQRSLASWAVTETARPEREEWSCGAFTLRYGYQRADLEVRGPPVYECVAMRGHAEETIYTTSGMSAIAALFTALVCRHGPLEVRMAAGGYGETRELFERFAGRIRVRPWRLRRGADDETSCVLFVDSVTAAIPRRTDPLPRAAKLVVFDTTCLGQTSGRIRRVLGWARRHDVPVALLRSHAKLDALGIEYGRLGSIVLTWRRRGPAELMRDLVRETRDTVRLFGSAAIPAHLPPFVGTPEYRAASVARTATIMRNTRRLGRRLRATPLADAIKVYPHALYLTLAPRGELRVQDVKRAVGSLCDTLSQQGIAVRHAGSFGFDFTAVEWFAETLSKRNVIRIAPGDLPGSEMDALALGITAWFAAQPLDERRRDAGAKRRSHESGASGV